MSIVADIVARRPRPSGDHRPGAADRGGSTAATATAPVCGMAVAAVEATLHFDNGGARHYFCGSGCLRAFAADP